MLDDDFRFLAVNAAAIEKYGYSREEFLQLRIHDLHPPEDAAAIDARPNEDQPSYDRTWRHRTRDGRMIDVEVHRSFVWCDGRRARLVVATDITERKVLEERLRRSQRMDAIGQLAGGIAHDFNNILTAIQGFAVLADDRMAAGEIDRESVHEISRAAERATHLTRQLLTFSRHHAPTSKVIRLGAVVQETMPMLTRLIGATISVKTAFCDTANVKADAGQMQQVIMNLVVNARDAMPEGGELSIRTEDVVVGNRDARKHPEARPGAYVVIVVSDTGHGIDRETQLRVFEPFFSTKPKGHGTGLGLATVYGIVAQSGGWIDLQSEVGHGTTLRIYLPQTQDVPEALPVAPRPVDDDRREEMILVVEDEAAVRTYVERVLRARGHAVRSFADPASAIAFARTQTGPINLVIADVVLPGMNGTAMANDACASHPEARVLYMSGFAEDAMNTRGWLQKGVPFLQKPFTPDALLRSVQTVLNR
jgi:two-component system, cell cycle sensor histidine kinase and response regulator CckA